MVAVYPGSFDPITYGHLDIITRASKFVDTLVVAVLNNSAKSPMFSVEERIVMLKKTCADLGLKNIKFTDFSGLLIDFAKEISANVIIRGLRAVTDFEYEFQMALTNRSLNSSVETLFISTSTQYLYLSSSVVKEVAILGGDISFMVPAIVGDEIKKKLEKIKREA